jgi:Holliday junction resolvase
MINIKSSGRYYEYKIKKVLEKNGYKVIRVPTSGTGKQPIPDIIAVKNNTIYAIEVKSTSKDYVNIDNFQIKKLFDFCEFFNFCNCKSAVIVNYKKYNTVLFYKLASYESKNKFEKFEYGINGEALSST